MQPESERLGDDDVYELDRKAWNLPSPRPTLTIARPARAPMSDGPDHEPRSDGDAEHGA